MLGVVCLILVGSTISALPHADSDVSAPFRDTEDTDQRHVLDEFAARARVLTIEDFMPTPTSRHYQADVAHLNLPTTSPRMARAANPEDLQAAKMDTSRFPEQTNIPGDNPPGDLNDLPNFVKCKWGKSPCAKYYYPQLFSGACYCILDVRPGAV